jgi:membrane peptidoglycan carboxypeptidase
MLQGVLARGTARTIAWLAPYVAGKTGTSDEENDAWFVGFTNEVTVAVWIGYDNADGKRRTLGGRRHWRPRRRADLRACDRGGMDHLRLAEARVSRGEMDTSTEHLTRLAVGFRVTIIAPISSLPGT